MRLLNEKIMATEDGKTQEELLDYEEDEEALVDAKGDGDDGGAGKDGGAGGAAGGTKKGHYVGIHASGFRDFLLKPELLRAVVDCGFEHPSEVQHECIPQVCNESRRAVRGDFDNCNAELDCSYEVYDVTSD